MTERHTEWNGISAGDAVKVRGLRGSFKFVCYDVNEGSEFVTCFGGTDGRERWRSVTPDRVERTGKKEVARGAKTKGQSTK